MKKIGGITCKNNTYSVIIALANRYIDTFCMFFSRFSLKSGMNFLPNYLTQRTHLLLLGVFFFIKGVNDLNIIEKKITEIKEYEKNPRKNDEAVKYVTASIKEFGFKVPVIIDKDNVIVAGHTRVRAAKELGMKTVPCIVADDLTEEQIKAFRLADNKVAEFSLWDFDLLNQELDGLGDFDMSDFGFSNLVDDTVSYIDDLLENEYAEHKVDTNVFSITFVFEKDYQQEILDYIDENGKEKIVELIVNHIRGLD